MTKDTRRRRPEDERWLKTVAFVWIAIVVFVFSGICLITWAVAELIEGIFR